jgi:cellulose synthase/poly-beta-1,6-N-acetylglucosamine synthase-like glycosyltransferase
MLAILLIIVEIAVGILLCYVSLSTVYLLFLAVAFLVAKDAEGPAGTGLHRFAILVPAHNEELVIGGLCKNLLALDYPQDHYRVFIIADNCTDRTVERCGAYPVTPLVRRDPAKAGKGHAIAWALSQIPLDSFDAVFLIDADTLADSRILIELGIHLDRGEQAIQCCNSIGNREESWFTGVLFVSRTVNNLLYHHAKYKLGLSSYLMGTGMCFTAALLRKKGWTAFTIGEDWEYSTHLAEDGLRIAFARDAVVRHQESSSLNQATSQRLRWSRGRFSVSAKIGTRMFWKGVRRADPVLLDASLPLIFPNYSLLANLTCLLLILSLLLPSFPLQSIFRVAAMSAIAGQAFLLITGACLAGSYWNFLRSIIRIPLFLCWKLAIDFASATGIYRGRSWVRTARSPDTTLAEESEIGEIYGKSGR